MIFTTIKLEISLKWLSIEEAQLLKRGLLQLNSQGSADKSDEPIISAMIVTIDQAIDQVMGRKYAGKVFGETLNVELANV